MLRLGCQKAPEVEKAAINGYFPPAGNVMGEFVRCFRSLVRLFVGWFVHS